MPATPSPASHPNRESWLADVAQRLAPVFTQLGSPLPTRLRCAVGFPSSGRRAKATGECWDSTASADATVEILLRPDLTPDLAAPDDGSLDRAYATALARQLVHAAVGPANGAGPAYKTLARALGLTGPMQALVPGPAFLALIAPILAAAGPLPHACLRPADAGDDTPDQDRKQASRHIKCACPVCGYVARTARKWLEFAGPPHCPNHGPMHVAADQNAVTAHTAVHSEPGASRPAATPARPPAPMTATAPTADRAGSAAPLLDLL